MKNFLLIFSVGATLLWSCAPNDNQKLSYPETKVEAAADTFFGTVIEDPYRWLEDDNSDETKAWVKAENNVTFNYLEKIEFRQSVNDRITELYDYEKYSAPSKEGEKYYFFKNDGLQNQSKLYVQNSLDGEAELFLDPNTFSEDGTTSLAGISFTEDGKLLAFSISEGGSDWRKVITMDTETKEIIGDTLIDVKFSGISWLKNEGFYYSSYDKPKEGTQLSGLTQYHKVYYHMVGNSQADDKLVFGGKATPRRYVGANVTEDNRYLILSAAVSTSGNELYVKDLSKKDSEIIPIILGYENDHYVVHSDADKLYVNTNLNAPNKKLVVVDLRNPSPENWKDLITEKEQVIRSASFGGGSLFINYLKDASSRIEQYDLEGSLIRTVDLPTIGTASGFNGKKEDEDLFYYFRSFTYPTTIFSFNVESGESKVFRKPTTVFNADDYETKQVFYSSKDGTRVPMFIVHKKGLELDGSNPTLLYGYGGFDISLTPSYSIRWISWIDMGGVFAMANLRGGGEYGEKWHKAGTKMEKQNVFDDFIAAAEFLQEEKYTSKEKLTVMGGSNGGLLVGATLTQRPDLMKVALPMVGVLDMLRYHKFTAGAGWISDYGCADSTKAMFNYLHNYSPYHNVKEGVEYPATLVTTADHDDRVVPAHSFKFTSALQKYQAGSEPVLIRIETKAGHGAGKPTSKIIEEIADMYSFAFYNMSEKPQYF